MTIYKTNYWEMEEIYHKNNNEYEELIEEEIIALGFDVDVDLKKIIEKNLDIEKYIEEKCEYPNFIKQFTKIKSGDFFIYISYKKEDSIITKIEYIGQIIQDFSVGYKLNSSFGHTLPIKWINKKRKILSQSIYTDYFYEVDSSELKKYLGFVQLEDDEKLLKELEDSSSKIFSIQNYLCDNLGEDEGIKTITIAVDSINQVNELKKITKGDYIIFRNYKNINNKENLNTDEIIGICKSKYDFKKEFIVRDKLEYKLEVEYVREPKLNKNNYVLSVGFYESINTEYISNNAFNSDLNTILYGPPGTGKTYNVSNEALKIYDILDYRKKFDNEEIDRAYVSERTKYLIENEYLKFCTFHQSYGYEEFIEGLKSDGDGNFTPEDGILKEIAIEALYDGLKLEKKIEVEIDKDNLTTKDIKDKKKKIVLENIYNKDSFDFTKSSNYILVIDEINRGNISKIFGELITLLEEDKRLTKENQVIVKLPYSKEVFSLPPNLYIVGTMNTSDKSIALMDVALRRRFNFKEMMPQPSLLSTVDGIELDKMLKIINERIEFLYDRDYMIGHAYLINVKNIDDISNIFKNKIIPLLQEYFYDDWEKIGLILGGIGNSKDDSYIVYKQEIKSADLFKNSNISSKYGSKIKYYIKDEIGFEELKNIYE
ncbi:McrB family protein [Paraclostridium sordellii]|uniref:McrB family protein n=1 Tax=Paraclostridium sordellii TaxID=1505 RepID=UPI0005DD3EE1|nr:AAA family ATPase [Paeniclostridium sordellii]CEO24221.1 restriction enzyme [[Clostridium] sordellii] [Paeniclostridium sordellii]